MYVSVKYSVWIFKNENIDRPGTFILCFKPLQNIRNIGLLSGTWGKAESAGDKV